MLTVGSLFSGIGGLDLGLERAGMRVIWQSEIDLYACRVLKKHWPEVPNVGDIKLVDWANIARPDVLCGGYPCQPFSTAGPRHGADDPRHLWPWVRNAISVLRPKYAILENVRGHLTLGGLSVIGDLASIGYDAEWRVVSAASVGANHRRDRIIIVAYPNRNNEPNGPKHEIGMVAHSISVGQPLPSERQLAGVTQSASNGRSGGIDELADADSLGLGGDGTTSIAGQEDPRRIYYRTRETGYVGWEWWETEPDVGRVADGVPHRVDRLRGLGNAVVPQVAEVIGRLVVSHAERHPQ
jgi:DNA (cytosine-5)-methyltransferase 1